MSHPPKLKFYERDDRENLSPMMDGLRDVLVFTEALQLMERYGLSVYFSDQDLEWTCTDPDGVFEGKNNTVAGAVIMWDIKREEIYGDDHRRKIRLVRRGDGG